MSVRSDHSYHIIPFHHEFHVNPECRKNRVRQSSALPENSGTLLLLSVYLMASKQFNTLLRDMLENIVSLPSTVYLSFSLKGGLLGDLIKLTEIEEINHDMSRHCPLLLTFPELSACHSQQTWSCLAGVAAPATPPRTLLSQPGNRMAQRESKKRA